MRQASRRSWRIGQRQDVEVTHLVYRGTLQAEALGLMSSKMRSSLMIEGELPEGGLAAVGGDDQDVMLALARRLTDQAEGTELSLEALFARRRESEVEGEEYLVSESRLAATEDSGSDARDLSEADLPALEQGSRTPTVIGAGGPAGLEIDTQAISFNELARLLRRPRPRRRVVSAEQLVLFDD